jgi:hypothetical protein
MNFAATLFLFVSVAYIMSLFVNILWIRVDDFKNRDKGAPFMLGAILTPCILSSLATAVLFHWWGDLDPSPQPQGRTTTRVYEDVDQVFAADTAKEFSISVVGDPDWIAFNCDHPERFKNALDLKKLQDEGLDLIVNVSDGRVVSVYERE